MLATFGRMPRESADQAERDEDAAGDVALVAGPTGIATKPADQAAREKSPEAITGGTHAGKENAERQDLRGDMPASWIDELRYKSKEEKSGLWIEHVDDDALAENASERGSRNRGVG